ncbi:hypothetical protein F889_01567 [Acinetobacter colistiniresistens]|uniref:Uncharacterized protein n=1 Tax=Acinetobacter colistiniresistens TaxID=280145 RepID=N9R701_9GAMM|nr:helix-turn-helix domain-containing protein [Acinetobacter colistiniresistens]ENX34927.1 hypothetical protein F889_01567 [Acinetobacter colistiniresistens]
MNIREKILFLRGAKLTQGVISQKTGIPQSSVSKIENNTQFNVSYSKGVALDNLVLEVKKQHGAVEAEQCKS